MLLTCTFIFYWASVPGWTSNNSPAAQSPGRCVQYFSTMLKFITAVFIFGLTACDQQKHKVDTKTLNFGAFTIEVPQSWTKVNVHAVDSYVGEVAIDNKDTLEFDLGMYSNKLYETDPTILDSSFMIHVDTNDHNFHSIIFVKNSNNVDLDEYRKNNVTWDTVDGRKAKIVYPRKSGIGTTGVYIDSLWTSRWGGLHVDHFNLYGENLKPENEKKILKALQTLKFYQK
jgi:hypothetical protein